MKAALAAALAALRASPACSAALAALMAGSAGAGATALTRLAAEGTTRLDQPALLPTGLLLADAALGLAAGAWTAAILAATAGPNPERTREVDLLHAIGFTPLQAAVSIALRPLLPAAAGALAGAAAVAATTHVDPAGGAAASLAVAGVQPLPAAATVLCVLAAVALAAAGPAIRAGTPHPLRAPVGGSRLHRFLDRWPLPRCLTLGGADAFTLPAPTLLTAASASAVTGGALALSEDLLRPGSAPVPPALLAGFAGLSALYILAGVGGALLLQARERARDLAVLRALGMAPGQIGAMLFAQAILPCLLGGLAGIPAGLAVHTALLGMPGAATYVVPLGIPAPLLIAPAGALLAALALARLMAPRAARRFPAGALGRP